MIKKVNICFTEGVPGNINDKGRSTFICYLSISQRQRIDATYTTGSGQRHEDDVMTQFEQACCDYAGEEVTLGKFNTFLMISKMH